VDDDMPHITLDFSNADDDGLLFARLARASQPLSAGMTVIASDADGNQARARVERIEGSLAFLVPEWDTWSVPSSTTTATTWINIPADAFTRPRHSTPHSARSAYRVPVKSS
jgi:hypothetical protein